MDTIPVKVHDANAMFTETEGLVQIWDDRVRLQLETKDAFVGQTIKTTEFNIPLVEISSISLKKGWLVTQLSIQVRDLDLVRDFPGSRLGEIRLRFKKKHRQAAERLTEMLDEELYQLQLAWDSEDQTPPPVT